MCGRRAVKRRHLHIVAAQLDSQVSPWRNSCVLPSSGRLRHDVRNLDHTGCVRRRTAHEDGLLQAEPGRACMPGERHRHQRFGRPGCAQTVVRRRDQVAFLLRTASRTDDPLWCHDVALHTCAPRVAALGRSHPAGQDVPRRRAIVQTGTVQPCGPRQGLRRSGSVNAWNTRARGASRMRIILSSRSLACVAALVLALLPARLLLLVHMRAA